MKEQLLVGYGTLLHRASLGCSIGIREAAAKRMRPVTVRGYRRLFNLRPDHYQPSACLRSDGSECGAMNAEPDSDAWFNGIAFPVTDDELGVLDERERYYRRLEAPLFDFSTQEPLGNGFVYSAELTARWIVSDPEKLLPLWRDVLWGRGGAYGIGQTFGRAFDATTYLADGHTLVTDCYRDKLQEAGDPIRAAANADLQ